MKRTTIILFVFIGIQLAAQTPNDSIVKVLNGIKFVNENEQKLFEDYFLKGEKNYFGLFYSITEQDKTEQEVLAYLNEQIDPIIAQVQKTNKRKKKVKLVFEKVHENMFLFYVHAILFPDIFRSASYNCLTATALFAIVFDRLQIPYSVIELPNHVYLVAYPDEEEIVVETTNPEGGYLDVSPGYKKEYVEYLRSNKLVQKEDINLTTNALFEKYYYANGKIDLEQLLGLHYVNHSLYLLEEGEYENAIAQVEKGLMFNQSDRLWVLYYAALIMQIESQNYNKAEHVVFLSKFVKHFVDENNRQQVKEEFYKLTNAQLESYPDPVMYKQSYELLDSVAEDSVLKAEFKYTYYYERGRVLALKGDYSDAYPLFTEAYKIQPNNVSLQTMISSIISDEALKMQDVNTAIDTLEDFTARFPELAQYKYIKLAVAYTHLRLAYSLILKRKISKAKDEIAFFEQNLPEEGPNVQMQEFIGHVYSEISSYYFRAQNRTKAKYYLKKGLEYAPGNYHLEKKLNLIERN